MTVALPRQDDLNFSLGVNEALKKKKNSQSSPIPAFYFPAHFYKKKYIYFIFLSFSFIHYNKCNTITEHVSTPAPTMDNRRIQTRMYRLCIHNKQKGTDVYRQTYRQRAGQSTSQTDILPSTSSACTLSFHLTVSHHFSLYFYPLRAALILSQALNAILFFVCFLLPSLHWLTGGFWGVGVRERSGERGKWEVVRLCVWGGGWGGVMCLCVWWWIEWPMSCIIKTGCVLF